MSQLFALNTFAALHVLVGVALVGLLWLQLSWWLVRPGADDNVCATSRGNSWLLYAIAFAAAVTGGFLALPPGWSNLVLERLHWVLGSALLIFIAVQVARAVRRGFIERIMQGLLPEARCEIGKSRGHRASDEAEVLNSP